MPSVGSAAISSPFARAIPSCEPIRSRCVCPTLVTTPIVGCAIAASDGDFAGAEGTHLQNGDIRLRADQQHAQRQAKFIVVAFGALEDAQAGTEQTSGQFFGARLPDAAGDPDDRDRELLAASVRPSALSARKGIINLDQYQLGRRRRTRQPDHAPRARRSPRRRRQGTKRCPSWTSPRIATKRSPGVIARESIRTCPNAVGHRRAA